MNHELTPQQYEAILDLQERFNTPLDSTNFYPQFDLPAGYVAGWVNNIYVGISPEGHVSS